MPDNLCAYLVIRAEAGTVLFKPTVCDGVTCKGLDRTKVNCRRKSKLLKPILNHMLPVHGLIPTEGV